MEGFGSATNADGTTGSFAPLDAVWVHNNCAGGFEGQNRFNFSEASRGATAGAATGSTLPRNLEETLATEEVKADPNLGKEIKAVEMTDRRWPAAEGWVKKAYNRAVSYGRIEVHYVWNKITGAVDDLKIILQGSSPPH